MKYLTLEERLAIEQGLKLGKTIKAIGLEIKRPASSLSNEIRANSVDGVYDGKVAHKLSRDRLIEKNSKVSNATLSHRERHIIARLIEEGKTCGDISKIIGRGKNTIVVEVSRNGGRTKYDADKAQAESDERYKQRRESTSNKLKSYAKTDEYFNPYAHLRFRIENLEIQIDILTETIRKLTSEN